MIVRRNLKWSIIFRNTWKFNLYMFVLSSLVVLFHDYLWMEHIRLPFSVVASLGTALALFLAFRNNSAYDRWWEARKIWGGVVNYSRTFARQVLTLVDNEKESKTEAKSSETKLIYRHLAWINALRIQLRKQNDWDQVSVFLTADEWKSISKKKNQATQLILQQAKDLRELYDSGRLTEFRFIQIDKSLNELYNLQGMAERIKNTPLPRQYDYFPRVFLYIFNTLLPLGIISLFEKSMITMYTIPLSMVIGFIFFTLMKIGQFNEDPFENRITDTPMTALCRTIEIDLREMLDETNLPPKLEPVDGFLY